MEYRRQPSVYLPDEYGEFRSSVRTFIEREIRPHVDDWERVGAVPRSLFATAGNAGFLGLRYDPKWGGSGMDFFATVVLCEELGKCDSIGVATSLMAHAEFSLSLIAESATDSLKEQYLVPAIRGELIGAIGISEPGAGSDVSAIITRAYRDGDGYIISGQKTFISNGTSADFITLAVRTGGPGPRGISVIVVPTTTSGFTMGRKLDKLGTRASDTGELFFDECRVPAGNLIGKEGQGMRYLVPHFASERMVLAGFSIGAMERLIELGLDYARDRHTFGTALTDYQTWRHRFAEMATRLEASRQLTYQAAYLLNRREPAAETAVSMAKLHAAAAVQFVAAEVLQLHGGFGQMEESPIPRYFRDVAGISVGAGTSEVMREIVARQLVMPREADLSTRLSSFLASGGGGGGSSGGAERG